VLPLENVIFQVFFLKSTFKTSIKSINHSVTDIYHPSVNIKNDFSTILQLVRKIMIDERFVTKSFIDKFIDSPDDIHRVIIKLNIMCIDEIYRELSDIITGRQLGQTFRGQSTPFYVNNQLMYCLGELYVRTVNPYFIYSKYNLRGILTLLSCKYDDIHTIILGSPEEGFMVTVVSRNSEKYMCDDPNYIVLVSVCESYGTPVDKFISYPKTPSFSDTIIMSENIPPKYGNVLFDILMGISQV
jgi:hypothetical protein